MPQSRPKGRTKNMPLKMRFEDQMDRLENIVNELENENTDLDTSLQLYEEGLDLSKNLKDELEKFQQKIDELNNGTENE